MEKQRGTTIAIVAALIIAVVSLGIAFAAFSTTLNVNGSATVQTSSWDIYFTESSGGTKPTASTALPSGNITGTAQSKTGSIVATTLTWNASFKAPGEYAIFKVYVKNAGSYNAKITDITKGAITCSTDPKSVCSHLHYEIYTDSSCTTALATNRALNAGSEDIFYLKAWLDDTGWSSDGSGLPTANVTSSTISATITYTQQ